MVDIPAAATALIEHLATYGVTAVTSPADLALPGVLINPPVVRPGFASTELVWTLLALASDSGRDSALVDLSGLLVGLSVAFPGQWAVAEPANYNVGAGLGDLPGYKITITQRLETQ